MMRKTIISIIVIMTLMIGYVMAEPSQWAIDLVESSESNGLVPETLKSNYQETVLRYEYVLLGLKVLDKYNIPVTIKENKPFNDIGGHPYATEIVRAYNAGIISGYSDHTFKPNNPISREEITALVYNLVKAINSDVALEGNSNLFYDQSAIESWALPYVNFAYRNSIMSGTGTINSKVEINPKGKATREQAIILLYKLSINTDLLNKTIPSITVNGAMNNELNGLALKTNYDFSEEIYQIQEQDDVQVDMLSENFIAISYEQLGSMQMNFDESLNELNLSTSDLASEIVEDYYSLVEDLYGADVVNMIKNHMNSLKEDSTYKFNALLKNNIYLNVFFDTELKIYAVQIDDLNL
ncbi:MAG: S-layer homology domain-containing protein [Clostridia bacterium]|nr:S-layer homology domain-containing protein [Clostridia bacterium]